MKIEFRKLMITMISIATMFTFVGCSSSNSGAAVSTTPEASVEASDNTGETADKTSTGDVSADVQKIIDAGVLKVGCKIDVPKFGLQNTESGDYEGVEIDLAYEIAGKIFGCTAEEAKDKDLVAFQGVTAKTRGGLLDSGEINLVIATFTITEERKESWNFSTPYYTDAVGLMVLADSGIHSINDLDGKVIGVAQGATTKDGFEAYVKENGISVSPQFEEFDGYPALSAALSTKNIDVFAVDRAILAGYNDESTKILEDRFAEQDYGVASALSNTGLAELVDAVVVDLNASGKMADMLTSWGIE